MTLRYYVYISDYKLDMLYEQIDPPLRRRISGELKISLKVASLTLSGESEPREATRMAKLRMVERYIDRYHRVGCISGPGPDFFRGSMDMKWGWLTPFDKQGNCRDDVPHSHPGNLPCGGGERVSPVVIFRGFQDRAEGIDFVLLGGSRRHVLGAGADDPAAVVWEGGSGSLLSALIEALENCVSQVEGFNPNKKRPLQSRSFGHSLPIEAGMYTKINGSRQRLEFLAIPYREAEIKIKDRTLHGIFGTPIYVAHG